MKDESSREEILRKHGITPPTEEEITRIIESAFSDRVNLCRLMEENPTIASGEIMKELLKVSMIRIKDIDMTIEGKTLNIRLSVELEAGEVELGREDYERYVENLRELVRALISRVVDRSQILAKCGIELGDVSVRVEN